MRTTYQKETKAALIKMLLAKDKEVEALQNKIEANREFYLKISSETEQEIANIEEQPFEDIVIICRELADKYYKGQEELIELETTVKENETKIQEQETKINEQKETIEGLEGKVEELEEEVKQGGLKLTDNTTLESQRIEVQDLLEEISNRLGVSAIINNLRKL